MVIIIFKSLFLYIDLSGIQFLFCCLSDVVTGMWVLISLDSGNDWARASRRDCDCISLNLSPLSNHDVSFLICPPFDKITPMIDTKYKVGEMSNRIKLKQKNFLIPTEKVPLLSGTWFQDFKIRTNFTFPKIFCKVGGEILLDALCRIVADFYRIKLVVRCWT